MEYGLRMPPDIYPIFENALRARRGLDRETHRRRMGALMSRFTQVAAKNPHAWFPVARSADELTLPAPNNRMIAYPYTKYSERGDGDRSGGGRAADVGRRRARARRARGSLGALVGRSARRGGGLVPERAPGLRRLPRAARRRHRLRSPRPASRWRRSTAIDFYSCFPVAVEMACEMLGLDENDPRGLTVTGGLPYAGGPGSNYTLHSLAAMAERLRARPGAKGLVTGNGWYLTRTPRASGRRCRARSPALRRPSRAPRSGRGAGRSRRWPRRAGRGTVETYTVLFDREGQPARGIVLGRTQTGDRFLANTPDDRASLEAFLASEDVGSVGKLSSHDGHNRFEPT